MRLSLLIKTLLVTLGACCASSVVVAAPPERPAEIDKAFEFKGFTMNAPATDSSSDLSIYRRLFSEATTDNQVSALRPPAAERGWLGIALKLPAAPMSPSPMIEIARVMPESGAEGAGLREGDRIVALDGKPLEDADSKRMLAFRIAISKKRSGDSVSLRLIRDGAEMELEAVLRAHPRVQSIQKPHPEFARSARDNQQSLSDELLAKEGLTDEFSRLLNEFHNETDKVVSPLLRNHDYNPFRLQEVNYVMNHPLDLPLVARTITNQLHVAFGKNHHDLPALIGTAMDELDLVAPPSSLNLSTAPSDITAYVERLLGAIQFANAERSAALSSLSREEIDFLYATAPQLLMGEWGPGQKERTEPEKRDDETRLLRFFRLVLKIDLLRLMAAGKEVARAIDLKTLKSLDKSAGKLTHYPKGWRVKEGKNVTLIDTPAGRVVIGGKEDNTYVDDPALILDFGGNDTYLNHAGGSTRQNPFSVVIDLTGDDLYSATEDFSQGAGLLGGGFLIDLDGNDRYLAKSYAQGAGILGIGILADLAGKDSYTAIGASQGAASFGVGLLAEGGGDDSYYGNYFVQGSGYIKGFGAIVEATGNDNYFAGGLYEDFRAPGKSYLSLSQGFGYGMRPWESLLGTSGGIGVIAEAAGNDTYVADYFAQGASYWFSLGILDDRKGHDRYISGRYSQGAGIHMSAGVLIDGEGDDNYLADYGVAQGCGHDYGIGILVDNLGNDRYISNAVAQGAGNDNGIGILSDNGGDDEYHLKSLGQGRGNFEPTRDLGSFGFLFDIGGNDIYSQGGKNNNLSYKTQWGIHLDSIPLFKRN